MREQGIFVPAIRYPTVARGPARLRVTLTAAHTPDDIHTARRALDGLVNRNRRSQIPMHPLAKLDHQYVWHPFTQMRDWLKREPMVIVAGQGAVLRDVHGREYLDANSSIWTNLHGHNHPQINAAIRRQLKKIAHSSALGLANEPAALLAKSWCRPANCRIAIREPDGRIMRQPARKSQIADRKLEKVFFSDNGSTALEVALKLAYEFTRRTRNVGDVPRTKADAFFPSQARITATPSARFRSATLICSTKVIPACCSRRTRSWRRIVIAVRSIGRSRSAPTPVNIANATGNASAWWNRNSPRKNEREILTRRLSSNH